MGPLLSCQNPLETTGEEAPGLGGTREAPGMRTSLKAFAPQLMRLTNGLVGLPDAGSESSMALSSAMEEAEETDDTEPLLKKLVCIRGGDPLPLDRLIRRWWFRCAAAEVIGPGNAPMGW